VVPNLKSLPLMFTTFFRYSLIITALDAIQPELLETTSDKTGNVGKRNVEARSRNHSCRGKVMFSLCVCIVALIIRHANPIFFFLRSIVLLSGAFLGLPKFSTLSHKRHDFRGKSY
jgi:hypothetical protein